MLLKHFGRTTIYIPHIIKKQGLQFLNQHKWYKKPIGYNSRKTHFEIMQFTQGEKEKLSKPAR